ncbi:MAG: hypothetical protein ACOYOB_21430 [Myxococcota bacterium]
MGRGKARQRWGGAREGVQCQVPTPPTHDFGHLVRGAFRIAEEDRRSFWDCHGPLDYAWLMRGDEMLDWFRAH